MDTTHKLNFFTTIRFLWNYIKDMKLKYFLFYVGWLFHTIVGVITPIIFGNMIDQIIYQNNLKAFIRMGLIFFGITVLGIILYYIVYEMYGALWNGLNRRLRMGMFEQLQRLTASEQVSLQHGDTVNMIQFWSIEGVNFMIRNIVHNVNNIFRILLCVGIIFYIQPIIGVVTLLMVPVSVFATFKISSRIRQNSETSKDKYAKYMSWLFEVADSLTELRLWSAKKIILKKYDNKQKELNLLNAKIEMDNTIGKEMLDNIKNLILVILYALLAYYAIFGNIQIGTITVMLSYFTLLSASLSELVTNNMDAQKRIAVIQRIYDFLGKEKIDSDVQKHDLEECITNITFENCSFGYETGQSDVLDRLNFSIHRGEKVAIVGSSGSGKSTLLNLILGLYEPGQGRILLNKTDMRQYRKSSLYEHISVVFQQVLLFKGTIRENLSMGEAIPEEKLIKACQAAGIYDYISNQEKGFDTMIDRRGKNLSGGQRQRMGIARAYLRKSDLVILDEATAALDYENEELILENWDEILQGRTCIAVSHRLQTVMKCDRIILLKDGKIHAIGTPEVMSRQCREFGELFADGSMHA